MPDEQEHAYNDPAIGTKEFLRAVMHDPTLPLGQRMDAATKLLPLELPPVPTYYGEFPISRTVALTIRITPLSGSADSPGAPEVIVQHADVEQEHVGFGPRDETVGAVP